MTENTQPDADPQLSALLRAAEHDAPPPDRALLERLREQSLAAFASSSSQPIIRKWKGRRTMFHLVRGLAAAVAAAILLGTGFYFWSSHKVRNPTLAEILERTEAAGPLHAKVITLERDGTTTYELWADFPNLVRKDCGGGNYAIAKGSQTWWVNETANQVRQAETGLWPTGSQKIASLTRTPLPEERLLALLNQAPTERTVVGGREYLAYYIEFPYGNKRGYIEALADPSTRTLHSLKRDIPGYVHNPFSSSSPIATSVEIRVLALNQPIPPDKFLIKDTLTEDGRVGKVVDVQGTVSLKPVMGERWTPVQDGVLLKPGDWVRTDQRGANAVALRLMKATGVIVGPGSIVEIVKPTEVRVLAGEIEFNVPDRTIDVIGPDGKKEAVKGKKLFRVEKEALVTVAQEPMWLRGFKGALAQVNESLGSLIAKVDGRDVPLTVGYHKVSVDIRDQIARTVIEESFVNRTKDTLEGVFYFPLPQDASISSFGMWIGNELVEADIVEKQRAREIYEEILRERRDPGLLEWAGGNLFKARVFPIFGHSEKRIKISYTQVLPLRAGRFRYSYGLQSELLQQHPLRELAIDVKISSAVPLKAVECPTHPTRRDQTKHSAHVEFAAQEYTPTRDFEVAAELDGRQNEVVLIPHRRGDDGYFMLQLLPSEASGGRQPPGSAGDRNLLPTGDPVHLLILADTSASMDKNQRLLQDAFLGALFASLTPKDTINLATCDVNCDWVFEKPQPAEAIHLSTIRSHLARRVSLGWTDLDKAFASAFKQAGAKTHVIYLGDGVVTTGDGDPQAFVKRLQLLASSSPLPSGGEGPLGDGVRGASSPPKNPLTPNPSPPEGRGGPEAHARPSCHAIALSSLFEPVVMKAIASLGGGSVRRVSGEQGPAAVARELLNELSQPSLRDLRVEFQGLQTARVYPDALPNLPPGSQQILLGRYLPSSSPLPSGGEGPGVRGANPPPKNPLTPNPSPPEGRGGPEVGEVIVTGKQGDKEVRFRAPISLENAEQGNSFIPRLWARMHLDRLLDQGSSPAIRDEIIALSEEFNIITPYTSFLVLESDADRERFKVQQRFRMRDGEKFFAQGRDNVNFDLVQQQMKRAGNWRLGLRSQVLREFGTLGRDLSIFQPRHGGRWGTTVYTEGLGDMPGVAGASGGGGEWYDGFMVQDKLSVLSDVSGSLVFDTMPLSLTSRTEAGEELGYSLATPEEAIAGERRKREIDEKDRAFPSVDLALRDDLNEYGAFAPGGPAALYDIDGSHLATAVNAQMMMGTRMSAPGGGMGYGGRGLGVDGRFGGGAFGGAYFRRQYAPDYTQWLDGLFPHLPPAPGKQKEPKSTWPEEAQKLARSLLRGEKLAKLPGGVEIVRVAESFDPRWNERTSRSYMRALHGPSAWLVRNQGYWSPAITHWCNAKERGVMDHTMVLGRLRTANAEDLLQPSYDLNDFSLSPLDRAFANYTVKLQSVGNNQTLLIVTHPTQADLEYETHLLIDTARHVLLKIEHWHAGKATQTVKFDDFVEVAGCWWARKIETFNDKNERTAVTTQSVTEHPRPAFDTHFAGELARRPQVQFLRMPLPRIDAAKNALAARKATVEDHLVLILHHCRTQQWAKVFEQLDQMEKLTDKPGMRWVRNALLLTARRHEDLRTRLLDETPRIAALPMKDDDSVEAGRDIALAEHVMNLVGQLYSGQEYLEFVDRLEKVYDRQPAELHARKSWLQLRLQGLDQMSRRDEALALRKEIATRYPRDVYMQTQYANWLAAVGDYDAAYAWLKQTLARTDKWTPDEEERIWQMHAQLLEQQGRYADLVPFLDTWVKRNFESSSAYAMYLSALVRTAKLENAYTVVDAWLAEGIRRADGDKPPKTPEEKAIRTRMQTAVSFMLGQGHQLYTHRIEERWLESLSAFVARFARSDDLHGLVNQVMGHHQFHQTDECRALRKRFAQELVAEIDTLRPAVVRSFGSWIAANDPPVAKETWGKVVDGLMRRWEKEADALKKHELGEAIVALPTAALDGKERIAFLQKRLATAAWAREYRVHYARALFDHLLTQSWVLEYENEAFALLSQLSDAEEPGPRLYVQIAALHRLTDAMVNARYDAKMKAVKEREKLTRTQLRDEQDKNRKAARQETADRLKKEATSADRDAAIRGWFNAERLYLDTLIERDLPAIAAECWKVLGDKPPAPKPAAEEQPKADEVLADLLRGRYLTLIAHLATRPKAEQGLAERLLKYADAGIAADAEHIGWKLFKWQLLIALDRPKELEQALRTWLGEGRGVESPGAALEQHWRQSLGYLLAELGRIEEAIKLFEAVEKADELGSQAYRALADWYMAVNRREQHDQAMKKVYQMMPEHYLSQALYRKFNPWQHGGKLPSELDRETLLIFAAVFEKSGAPGNYIYLLQQFYQASRDFRLLAVMVDAVVGHSAGKVYPFVQHMQTVFNEIRDEATVDQIAEQLVETRKRAKSAVDQRALDFVELQVRRRAAELKDQPGPHRDAAIAAMQRMFKGTWSDGEPRLMADLLASLGVIKEKPLADEQLKQLRAFYDMEKPGKYDRLHIGHRWASTINGYARHAEAIDLLEGALREFIAANDGRLPESGNEALYGLVHFHWAQQHFARAETVLLERLKKPVHEQQRFAFEQQLYHTYHQALANRGEVSLGKELVLYKALNRRLQEALNTPDHNHRYQLMDILGQVYGTAYLQKLAGLQDDLRAFAFTRLPEVLKTQTNHYETMVGNVAQWVHKILGPRDGIAFLLDRIENEPGWLRLNNQDGWSRHGSSLAHWRVEAGNLGDLEARLLKVVVVELRRDLESRQQRSRIIYVKGNQHFWAEKEEAFARTAEEVLNERKKSGAAVQYIAEYLYHGLSHYDRAIAILFDSHRENRLNDAGQFQLVTYLHWRKRHGESIPLLTVLVDRVPEWLNYRLYLMTAYHRTQQRDKLLALLKDTDTFFHQKDRWQESVIAALANNTVDNELFDQAVAYLNELIPLHQRTQPNRGIGNGTLSGYYMTLARAYQGLKKTPEAVDAASGAVVSWGPRHGERRQALYTLVQVLKNAPDLDGYVTHWNGKVNADGKDSPVIRKAIGQAYLEKEQFAKAIAQLRLATELQGTDIETHQALLTALDRVGDKEGAVRQLLATVELMRREIGLYKDLGERLQGLGRSQDAERAFTSIVEMLPTESESHTMLAEIRETQTRWPDAIGHWEQVARIRALEPTGLIRLGQAQVHAQQWDAAKETLKKLRSRPWPQRFSDVDHQTRELERQLEKGK